MSEQGPIRVLVIERHAIVSEGLRLLLSDIPEVELVGAAGGAAEALRLLARSGGVDVVVTDLDPPGLDLATLVRRVAALTPHTAVLAMSLGANPVARQAALAAGAVGCVRKQDAVRELPGAIRAAARRG